MALDKAQLESDLTALFTATASDTNAATALSTFVAALATAIDNYVKTAAIVYDDGLVVPSGGPVTGVFNGNLE
jgi:hypothetical protein